MVSCHQSSRPSVCFVLVTFLASRITSWKNYIVGNICGVPSLVSVSFWQHLGSFQVSTLKLFASSPFPPLHKLSSLSIWTNRYPTWLCQSLLASFLGFVQDHIVQTHVFRRLGSRAKVAVIPCSQHASRWIVQLCCSTRLRYFLFALFPTWRVRTDGIVQKCVFQIFIGRSFRCVALRVSVFSNTHYDTLIIHPCQPREPVAGFEVPRYSRRQTQLATYCVQ